MNNETLHTFCYHCKRSILQYSNPICKACAQDILTRAKTMFPEDAHLQEEVISENVEALTQLDKVKDGR